MGREAGRDAFVSIRKEGPTHSYLVPLFVFYTGSDPSYTRCLHLLKNPFLYVRGYIAVHDGRIVLVKIHTPGSCRLPG